MQGFWRDMQATRPFSQTISLVTQCQQKIAAHILLLHGTSGPSAISGAVWAARVGVAIKGMLWAGAWSHILQKSREVMPGRVYDDSTTSIEAIVLSRGGVASCHHAMPANVFRRLLVMACMAMAEGHCCQMFFFPTSTAYRFSYAQLLRAYRALVATATLTQKTCATAGSIGNSGQHGQTSEGLASEVNKGRHVFSPVRT